MNRQYIRCRHARKIEKILRRRCSSKARAGAEKMRRVIVAVLIVLIAAVPVIRSDTCECDARAHYTVAHKTEWHCIGTFKVTAYSYAEGGGENYSTASGRTPIPYYTVATDPDIIPTGTEFKIQGLGKVRADDTGGAIHGNIIDYHVGYDSCDTFGVKYLKVYIKEE